MLAASLARITGRSEGLSEEAAERLREILALALLAITLFIGVACASAGRGANLCGPTGEALATHLLGGFGYAAWLIVLCFASWSVALFARAELPSFGLRGFGLLLCLVSLSALLSHLVEDGTRWPPGGYLGEYIHLQLVSTGGLGLFGTRIVLIALTLMSFVLATDIAYYAALVGGARWAAEKAEVLREAAEERRERKEEERLQREKEREKEERRLAREQREAEKEARRVERERKAAEKAAAAEAKAAEKARKAAEQEAIEQQVEETVEDPELFDDEDVGEDVEYEEDGELEDDEEYEEEDDVEEGEELAADDEELDEDEDPDGEELEADEEQELADDEEWVEDEDGEEYDEEEDPEAEEEEWAEADEAWGADGEDEFEDDDGEQLADDEEWEYEDEEDDGAAEGDDDVAADDELQRAATGPVIVDASEEPPPEGQSLLPFDPHMAAGSMTGPPEVVSAYAYPAESLLDDQEHVDQTELDALLAEKVTLLEETLLSFKIEAKCVEIQKGPVISMFEMSLAPGIKVEKLRSLEDDLAIALKARTVRIVAPLPGKNTIGIEVPNPVREMVRMKPLLHADEYDDAKMSLPIFLGKDAAGRPMVVDLAKMPHLLVAGATGSGKSVCLNTIIVSFLFTRSPEQVKLILIDPKMVEMSQFAAAPHLACPVINDMKRAPGILEWAVNKMEERYRLLAKAGVRNIHSYNKIPAKRLRDKFGEIVDDPDFPKQLPFIVIIVDELADLMMTAAKDVEASITRLAAKSRAVGIHIILATQRPSTNVITGLIKANLPTRVAFMVSSKIDSRVILDTNGAEQLLGQGDMLFMPPGSSHVARGQCTFLSEEEVAAVMAAIETESGPLYEKELTQRKTAERDPTEVDDLYDAAARFVLDTRRGSASLLQRKFAIGYTRASRLIDLMAEEGIIGEYKGSQAREVQMTLPEWVALNPEAREHAEEGEAV